MKKKLLSRNFNFLLLIQGQTISRLGSILYRIIMSWKILEITGSGTIMAAYLATESIPRSFAKQISGIIVDRLDRVKVIYITDFINSINIFIVLLLLKSSLNITYLIIILFGLAFIKGITDSFFSPAIFSTIPYIVEENELSEAFATNQASYQIAGIVGIALGATIISIFNVEVLILINAVSYLYSGMSEMFIKLPYKNIEHSEKVKIKITGIIVSYKENIQRIINNKRLKTEIILSVLFMAGTVALITPIQVYVFNAYSNANMYMYVSLGSACGALASTTLIGMGKIKTDNWNYKKVQSILLLLIIGYSLVNLSIVNGMSREMIIIIPIFVLLNFFAPLISVSNTSAIVKSCDKRFLGSIMGFKGSLHNLVEGILIIAFGLILDFSSLSVALIVIILFNVFLLIYVSRHIKNIADMIRTNYKIREEV